jgi:hypothetical protein
MFNCIDSELFFNKAEAEKKLAELKGEVWERFGNQ